MAQLGLRPIPQDDFAAGRVTAVAPHLVPRNGMLDAVNTLLDDDGSTYRRGGATFRSNAAFGATGLTWVWDGYLAGGQRTVFASSSAYGVLDVDGATPLNLGGAGVSGSVHAVALGGIVFLSNGTMYAGSRKLADYSAGSIAVSQGSTSVTGTGTSFTANVDAGMLIRVGGAGRYYVVKSVNSNTSITLADNYEGVTAGAAAYVASRFGSLGNYFTQGPIAAVGVVEDRLLVGTGNRVYFTRTLAQGGPHIFDPTDYHEFSGGAQVIGVVGVRNLGLVFATDGMWVIRNMAYDLTDLAGGPQQGLERLSREVILWDAAGIVSWGNAVIAPAVDAVWMVDGISINRRLSASITPDIVDHVGSGHRLGAATVHRSHYFMPVLDAAGNSLAVHVCRLDRPTADVRLGTIYPWTRIDGFDGEVSGFAEQVSAGTARLPTLLASSTKPSGRVLDCTAFFHPSPERARDADGGVHVWTVTLPDAITGPGLGSHTKRLRIRYEMTVDGVASPVITAQYSIGEAIVQAVWGKAKWGLFTWDSPGTAQLVTIDGAAPADDGNVPYTYTLRPPQRTPRIRAKLRCARPTARLTLRSAEWFVRPTGKM